MDSSAILAVTHDVTLQLKGEAGHYSVEHRTVGLPDDDLLADLATAARRTYERIHGVPPERLHVFATPLPEDVRDRERERVKEDLQDIRSPGRDDLSELHEFCEDLFGVED